jgi:hypothetical protein
MKSDGRELSAAIELVYKLGGLIAVSVRDSLRRLQAFLNDVKTLHGTLMPLADSAGGGGGRNFNDKRARGRSIELERRARSEKLHCGRGGRAMMEIGIGRGLL